MKLFLFIFLILSFSISFSKPKRTIVKDNEIVKIDSKYSFKIINSIENTYGYDILVDNKTMIHQPNIPAVGGNLGFKNKKHAEKVAELVINKLKNNIMPPSVTTNEIDSIKQITK